LGGHTLKVYDPRLAGPIRAAALPGPVSPKTTPVLRVPAPSTH
jgi:hypothetical protein